MCADSHAVKLTADFYQGDRAMRESGFDPSFRWGPFDGSTHHYAPICLNSLLYKAENDLAQMATMLGKPKEAQQWRAQAEQRKQIINKLLWSAGKGLFFDYDFMTSQLSSYNYVTTFYPLWVGLATPQQAKALIGNLGLFEHPGGLAMSDHTSGVQWDLPFGWAPTMLIAVEGMRQRGYNGDADRVSRNSCPWCWKTTSATAPSARSTTWSIARPRPTLIGYHENVIGFGWTNGTFLVLLHALPQSEQQAILKGAKPKAATAH